MPAENSNLKTSALVIECPHCHARYRIDTSKASKDVVSIRCPGCTKVFSLSIKAVASESPALPVDGQPATPVTAAAEVRRKILIVDDAKFFREVIVDLLKPLNVVCQTAASAEEALAMLRRERPALLLLDLNLPGQNGYELIRNLRADVAFAGLKILAMSGVFRDEADIAAVGVAGADDFISKSFKPEQLQLRIRKLLDS